jgi:ribosomal protein L14E/L6E/L27E
MSMIKEGTVCVLCMGRRKGEEVTISKVIDDNFVMVKDRKGKERKSSVRHLMPAQRKAK